MQRDGEIHIYDAKTAKMKAQKKKESADPFNEQDRIDHLNTGYWERVEYFKDQEKREDAHFDFEKEKFFIKQQREEDNLFEFDREKFFFFKDDQDQKNLHYKSLPEPGKKPSKKFPRRKLAKQEK